MVPEGFGAVEEKLVVVGYGCGLDTVDPPAAKEAPQFREHMEMAFQRVGFEAFMAAAEIQIAPEKIVRQGPTLRLRPDLAKDALSSAEGKIQEELDGPSGHVEELPSRTAATPALKSPPHAFDEGGDMRRPDLLDPPHLCGREIAMEVPVASRDGPNRGLRIALVD